MEKQKAINFFGEWKLFTIEALKQLAPTCPSDTPIRKTIGWSQKYTGGEGPCGLMWHFTGGPNGIASCKWANEHPDNKGSSWHATILDHRIVELDHVLAGYPLVKEFLPVTALFIGRFNRGCWHGNWANRKTWGNENRNLGELRKRGDKFYRGKRLYKKEKYPVLMNGRWFEPFTRGQIVANIMIGRALLAVMGRRFVPEWCLPHSAVWWIKNDTGLAWPHHFVRHAIFSDKPIDELYWLGAYGDTLELEVYKELEEDEVYDILDQERDCVPEPKVVVDFEKIDGGEWRSHLSTIRRMMYTLGYYMPNRRSMSTDLEDVLKTNVTIFQRSTAAMKGRNMALQADGVPGKKTFEAMLTRVEKLCGVK